MPEPFWNGDHTWCRQVNDTPEAPLIIAGIVLLLLGLLLGVGILYTIGIILIIVGAVLWVVGSTGRAVGGRRGLLLTPPWVAPAVRGGTGRRAR